MRHDSCVCRRVYCTDVEKLVAVESMWRGRRPPTPLHLEDIVHPGANGSCAEEGGKAGEGDAGTRGSGTAGVNGGTSGSGKPSLQSTLPKTESGEKNGDLRFIPLSSTLSPLPSPRPPHAAPSACRSLGLLSAHSVWDLRQNARVFLEAVRLFLDERGEEVGALQVGWGGSSRRTALRIAGCTAQCSAAVCSAMWRFLGCASGQGSHPP